MNTMHTKTPILKALVAMTVLLGGLSGCDSDDAKTCKMGDKTYTVGQTFPSDDGCNTCSCDPDGNIACTAMACLTSCTYDNQTYVEGQAFPSTDGCNTCSCGSDGGVSCTEMACVTTCTEGGTTYNAGDTFAAVDGCNTCTCGNDGTVSCTAMACVTCSYGGVTYQVGAAYPALDGCNTCECLASGETACTELPCVPTGCTYERQNWDIGETFPARDGCNTCTCETGGGISCTEMVCPESCPYEGEEFPIGATFPAGDGCNDCTCQPSGEPSCTKRGCVCNPETEWWRHYVGLSPEACLAIRIVCPENAHAFFNACGCGCQQFVSCPQEIDCAPGECDAEAEAARCPYSVINTATRCTTETPCADGFARCDAPGDPFPCGRCYNIPPNEACESDAECGRNTICQPMRCACFGGSTCVPGCQDDVECGEGRVCGVSGRCERVSCGTDSTCPDNFTCGEGTSTNECHRTPCDSSTSCDGYCVNGSCYDRRGECSYMVP